MSDGKPDSEQIGARVRVEIDRAIKRNIKGLDFLIAPRQSVGAMEKDLLLRDGTAALYRYRPLVDDVYRVPLLIVSPPSNRGYIFDLTAGQSFVEYMLKAGFDVFLLDWMPPKREEAGIAIEDYVLRFIPEAIAQVQKEIFDLVITDFHLGEGDGLSILSAQRSVNPSARGIVVSGDGDQIVAQKVESAGAAFFKKPVSPLSLRAYLSSLFPAAI